MQTLDALEAIRWAYVLCAYGEENFALALEFFKARVRRATGDYGLQEVKYLWLSGSWRFALAVRKGQSFDEAVVAMINDLPRQSEQAAAFRQEYPESSRANRSRSRHRRSRERGRKHRSRSPGKRGGKGAGKDKGKGKKPLVDTSHWLTEASGSEICRNWNSLCGRTQCSRTHVCAICQGNHRATDKAHH